MSFFNHIDYITEIHLLYNPFIVHTKKIKIVCVEL